MKVTIVLMMYLLTTQIKNLFAALKMPPNVKVLWCFNTVHKVRIYIGLHAFELTNRLMSIHEY